MSRARVAIILVSVLAACGSPAADSSVPANPQGAPSGLETASTTRTGDVVPTSRAQVPSSSQVTGGQSDVVTDNTDGEVTISPSGPSSTLAATSLADQPSVLSDAAVALEVGWNRLADPPLSPRTGATVVWTGEEVVVVGGYSDSVTSIGRDLFVFGGELWNDDGNGHLLGHAWLWSHANLEHTQPAHNSVSPRATTRAPVNRVEVRNRTRLRADLPTPPRVPNAATHAARAEHPLTRVFERAVDRPPSRPPSAVPPARKGEQ